MVEILWHSQTKGRATVNTNFHLNHRVTSRLYVRCGTCLVQRVEFPPGNGRFAQ
jgi:hypothetical protein